MPTIKAALVAGAGQYARLAGIGQPVARESAEKLHMGPAEHVSPLFFNMEKDDLNVTARGFFIGFLFAGFEAVSRLTRALE